MRWLKLLIFSVVLSSSMTVTMASVPEVAKTTARQTQYESSQLYAMIADSAGYSYATQRARQFHSALSQFRYTLRFASDNRILVKRLQQVQTSLKQLKRAVNGDYALQEAYWINDRLNRIQLKVNQLSRVVRRSVAVKPVKPVKPVEPAKPVTRSQPSQPVASGKKRKPVYVYQNGRKEIVY